MSLESPVLQNKSNAKIVMEEADKDATIPADADAENFLKSAGALSTELAGGNLMNAQDATVSAGMGNTRSVDWESSSAGGEGGAAGVVNQNGVSVDAEVRAIVEDLVQKLVVEFWFDRWGLPAPDPQGTSSSRPSSGRLAATPPRRGEAAIEGRVRTMMCDGMLVRACMSDCVGACLHVCALDGSLNFQCIYLPGWRRRANGSNGFRYRE